MAGSLPSANSRPWSLSMSSNQILVVQMIALTLTGLVVRAMDPMRQIVSALSARPAPAEVAANLRKGLLGSADTIERIANEALLLGANASFLGGIHADQVMTVMSPVACSICGYALWVLGWFSILYFETVGLYVGCVCLGLAFPAILNSTLFLSALNTSNVYGLSILSTSADVSSAIPFLLHIIILLLDLTAPQVRWMLAGFAVLSTIISASATLFTVQGCDVRDEATAVTLESPGTEERYSRRSTGRSQMHLKDYRMFSSLTGGANVYPGYATFSDKNTDNSTVDGFPHTRLSSVSTGSVLSSTGEAGTTVLLDIVSHSPSALLQEIPLISKLTHPLYLIFAVSFCFNIFRMCYFLCWNRRTLLAATHGLLSASVDRSMYIYNGMITFAFIPGFVWGQLSQKLGPICVHAISNGFGVFATYAITSTTPLVQRIALASFVIHLSFVFSGMFCYLSELFGFQHLALLEGLLAVLSAAANCGVILIGRYQNGSHQYWCEVSRFISAAGILMFLAPLALYVIREKLQRRSSIHGESKRWSRPRMMPKAC